MKTSASLEEIYAPVEPQLHAIPETILQILEGANHLSEEVIRYFFSSKGKLLRPALTLLGGELKSIPPLRETRLMKLAAAYEIFHGATLIHDDIIDSAYLRRNIPTINSKWGAQAAVLVGDYLHDKAMGTIFQSGTEVIFNLFLKTAGIVCDGEIHELKEKGNFGLTEAEYLEIVDKKTASLLACTVQSGAMLGGATPAEVEALGRFGRFFGIAFQIVDDCLDFTGNEEEFGKTLGADISAGVLTLPLIRVLQVAAEPRRGEIIRVFKSETYSGKFRELLDLIEEFGAISYSMDLARKFADDAREELEIFPDAPARRSLERLVDYVLERQK